MIPTQIPAAPAPPKAFSAPAHLLNITSKVSSPLALTGDIPTSLANPSSAFACSQPFLPSFIILPPVSVFSPGPILPDTFWGSVSLPALPAQLSKTTLSLPAVVNKQSFIQCRGPTSIYISWYPGVSLTATLASPYTASRHSSPCTPLTHQLLPANTAFTLHTRPGPSAALPAHTAELNPHCDCSLFFY